MNLFISSILAAAIATTSSTAVDAYDGPVSWSISDFVKQAKDLKFVQKGEEKKSVQPQFIRKHDDDEDEKKSSGEDKEDEDKDDESKDEHSGDEGESKFKGICNDPDNELDKEICDDLCNNICDDSNNVLCCKCLGCPGDEMDANRSFIRGGVGMVYTCLRDLSSQDLVGLYDNLQGYNPNYENTRKHSVCIIPK